MNLKLVSHRLSSAAPSVVQASKINNIGEAIIWLSVCFGGMFLSVSVCIYMYVFHHGENGIKIFCALQHTKQEHSEWHNSLQQSSDSQRTALT